MRKNLVGIMPQPSRVDIHDVALFLAKTPQACESRRVTMLRASLDAIHSSRGSSFGEEQGAHGSWRYADAELESQFRGNTRLTPGRILPNHLCDERAEVFR
jgi:hypothetical protein